MPTHDLRYATTAAHALRRAGATRAQVFRIKRNPLDFDYPGRPTRTPHHCEALGRMEIGSHAWVWFEYDERETNVVDLIEVAQRHHLHVTSVSSPYNPALHGY